MLENENTTMKTQKNKLQDDLKSLEIENKNKRIKYEELLSDNINKEKEINKLILGKKNQESNINLLQNNINKLEE